jgi:hypothetical protein
MFGQTKPLLRRLNNIAKHIRAFINRFLGLIRGLGIFAIVEA